MSVPVLVAVPGAVEATVVAGWEAHRREVVVARRCADLADLLAAAQAGLGRAALVGWDLPGLDADSVARLGAAGLAVVVLVPGDDEEAERRCRQMRLEHVAEARTAPGELAALVAAAARLDRDAAVPTRSPAFSRAASPPADGLPATARPAPGEGRVVAVWSPAGSTGRTTVAVNLAAELAVAGQRVLLVDADTYGASVAQVLGLLDEAPSVLAAVRAAGDGRWDVPALHRTAAEVLPGLRVLTGAADPTRWHELRPGPLEVVLDVARRAVDWVLLDVASCAEHAEEALFDAPALRRNAATLTALAVADLVLPVGLADPIGLQRFLRAWQALPELAAGAGAVPVVNRVRSTAVGRGPERRVADALLRFGGVEHPSLLPDDGPGCDAALLQGRALCEVAPRSPLRQALRHLADRVVGEAVPTDRWRVS